MSSKSDRPGTEQDVGETEESDLVDGEWEWTREQVNCSLHVNTPDSEIILGGVRLDELVVPLHSCVQMSLVDDTVVVVVVHGQFSGAYRSSVRLVISRSIFDLFSSTTTTSSTVSLWSHADLYSHTARPVDYTQENSPTSLTLSRALMGLFICKLLPTHSEDSRLRTGETHQRIVSPSSSPTQVPSLSPTPPTISRFHHSHNFNDKP